MIDVQDKSKCCGCTSCMNACPSGCIVMKRDAEGFEYPSVDAARCVDCGRCEKVCPVINPAEERPPLKAFAVRHGQYCIQSSSGGVFPMLAEMILEKNGVVYGAVMDEEMSVCHRCAEDMDGVEAMRGSKYVQSCLGSVFAEVRNSLEDGRTVLYTGTPCQIAGLKAYLGRDYEGLFTVDCACHGVPSPGLWEMYTAALERIHGKKIGAVRFRDKSRSWIHYDFSYKLGDRVQRVPYVSDPFMALFVQDVSLRPSCYVCPAGNGRSGADLTIADLWNVRDVVPEMNDDKGVSLVLANTDKGLKQLTDMNSQMQDSQTVRVQEVVAEDAMKNNGGFSPSLSVPPRRTEFFAGLSSASDLIAYMRRFVVSRPLHIRIYRNFRMWLYNMKRRIVG